MMKKAMIYKLRAANAMNFSQDIESFSASKSSVMGQPS